MQRSFTRASRPWMSRARRALLHRLGDDRGMALVLALAVMLALAMVTSMFVLSLSAAHRSDALGNVPAAAGTAPAPASRG